MRAMTCGAMAVLLTACGAIQDCAVPMSFALEPNEKIGPLMRQGQSCSRCHAVNGQAGSKPFSVGGTLFATANASAYDGVLGATVRVTDANGKNFTMVSNELGNFWSETVASP